MSEIHSPNTGFKTSTRNLLRRVSEIHPPDTGLIYKGISTFYWDLLWGREISGIVKRVQRVGGFALRGQERG